MILIILPLEFQLFYQCTGKVWFESHAGDGELGIQLFAKPKFNE